MVLLRSEQNGVGIVFDAHMLIQHFAYERVDETIAAFDCLMNRHLEADARISCAFPSFSGEISQCDTLVTSKTLCTITG